MVAFPIVLTAHSSDFTRQGFSPMRRVNAALFQSVAGVVESPNLWQFDSFDDSVGAAMGRMIEQADTVLLGRVSYEEWSGYWPNADPDHTFAAFINPVEKFVATTTLTNPLDWQNSTVIEGGLEDFVRSLKASDGGNIVVCGSISVVRHLLFAGLLDTLTLMVHPVVAGTGKRLFEPTDPTTRLVLGDSQVTGAGNAILTYSLRPE